MPIDPAQLARSLGALGSLGVEQGLAVTLPQVLRSAKTLLDADQLQVALEHRSLIEQAVQVLVDREGLDAPAAFQWLATAAKSSGSTLVQVARAVVGGAPLPSDRLAQAKERRREATDREVAVQRRDSESHEGAARRYQRRGRAQTERLAGGRGARPDHRRRSRTAPRRQSTLGSRLLPQPHGPPTRDTRGGGG